MSRAEERTYVVSYDVADNRRRARMARLMESQGKRVQWSVFEIVATSAGIAELLARATRATRFDAAQDSLRCYPLCAACRDAVEVRGLAEPAAEPGRAVVL